MLRRQKSFFIPYFKRRNPNIVFGFAPHIQDYTPQKVAQLYSFPAITPVRQVPIAVIELGGGYKKAQIDHQFATWNLPAPIIKNIGVMGAKNTWHKGRGADGEVVLDIVVAAAVYSYCTGQPAKILAVFAPNSDKGFIRAVKKAHKSAVRPVVSISWGGPEDTWQNATIAKMNNWFSKGNDAGCTFFCASGDAGSGDGEAGNHVDFPGSSPFVVCCGGTTLLSSGNTITSETVWNNDPNDSATGGGYSNKFTKPAFQNTIAGTQRGVPDCSGNADPNTGYITPLGVIGGTSAVAPLMAGLFAAINAGRTTDVGFVNTTLYNNPSAFRDITSGNNGSFSASTNWDAASGLGVPIGTSIQALFP